MIPCSEAVKQLWEYLDRTLAAEDHAQVEHHLALCRRCCGEMELAKELRSFLAMHASEEIPADVRDRLDRFLTALGR